MVEIKKNMELINELLKLKEGIHLDFKQSINKSSRIAKTMVAFANTEGGKIAVGISDKKVIKGIDAEEEIYMIEKANREFCVPPVPLGLEVFEIDYLDDKALDEELYVLLVQVFQSKDKHYFKNHDGSLTAYIRVEDETLPSHE